MRKLLPVLVVLFAIGVIVEYVQTTISSNTLRASVMVIRDLDEIRFTNDSGFALHNCPVQIDGFSANLPELPAGQRASLHRSAFDRLLPRDEFFRRARTLDMHCYDDTNAKVEVQIK